MSTTLNIVDQQGKAAGSFEVPEAWLERERGMQAVTDSVVAYRAAGRAGTAATKTRGKVSGSNAKPWRQKGTGRARSGRRTSPIWRGGGIIFGPEPRSYAKKLNKKVRRLAMRRVLAERIDEGALILVDDLAPDAPKTKGVLGILAAIGAGEDVLIVSGGAECKLNENLVLGARNLPMVNLLTVDGVSVYHMMLHGKVVFTKDALEALGARIAPSEKAEAAAPVVETAEEPVAVEAAAEEVVESAADEAAAEAATEQANIETMVIDVDEVVGDDDADDEETAK